MADILRKDPKFLRSCILYEVLHGKSVEEAYKNLCKVMGNNFMEFTEFDFHFYRFYHGNYDLDYDRKSDPKSRLLSELSIDVIGKIMENLELKEQFTLRKVSRGFQYLIDQLKLAYASIYIFCEKDHIYTEFNDSVVVYTNTGHAKEVKKNYQHELPIVIEGSDFVKMAYNDIEIALKSPKTKLESIELNYVNFMGQENAEKIYDGIRNLLKTIKHKIPVKRFSIKTARKLDVIEILSSLKPGILENVSIEDAAWATWEENVSDFNKIDELVTMDQWKMAKVMNIRAWISTSIKHFFHFESFDARIDFIPTGDVIKLRDALFKSANFEKCCVKTREELNDTEIERLLGQYVIKMRNRPDLRFYPIPNSKEFLQFTVDINFIIVKREK